MDVQGWAAPMKNVWDQIAKTLVPRVLGRITHVQSSMDIRGHVLEADLWVEPKPEHAADLERLGMLGRMVALGPCLIEPFSGVPAEHEIRSCILKQYSLHHDRRREAKERDQDMPPFPRLWVVSTGSPDRVIAAMDMQPMPDWPEGCLSRRPFDQLHLIVVRKLPRTRETLLIRLLSRGKTFSNAVTDLLELRNTVPELAFLAAEVMHVLIAFKNELHEDQLEEEEMEALRDIDAAYAEWEREVKTEENREIIRLLCQQFEIELTDERLAQMATWTPDQLKQALMKISAVHEWPGS